VSEYIHRDIRIYLPIHRVSECSVGVHCTVHRESEYIHRNIRIDSKRYFRYIRTPYKQVYIDFGHHPGQDRLPREAVQCGCVVITGKRGSGNQINIYMYISTAYCLWGVISPFSNLNRRSTTLALLPHSVQKRLKRVRLEIGIEKHSKCNRNFFQICSCICEYICTCTYI